MSDANLLGQLSTDRESNYGQSAFGDPAQSVWQFLRRHARKPENAV